MADKDSTKNGESNADNRYSGEQSVKGKAKKEKPVSLMFRGNRSFEFKYKRIMYRFEGRTVHELPSSVLDDPDFKRIQHYFIVKES